MVINQKPKAIEPRVTCLKCGHECGLYNRRWYSSDYHECPKCGWYQVSFNAQPKGAGRMDTKAFVF